MIWNVASARDDISLSKWSGGTAYLRTFRGSIGYKKLFCWQQFSFFTHVSLNIVETRGGQTCSIEVSFAKKQKPASRKCSLYCQYKYGEECKFYINWCTVIVSIKFLFDFLENLHSTLLKMCKLILPSVHFSGVDDSFILETSLHRKQNRSNMLCYTQKWVIHWYFKFWVFTSLNLSPEIEFRVSLTKVFWARFPCISVSFDSTADNCYSSGLEEPHKMSATRNSPTYVAYRYQQSLSHYITCQNTCVQ